MKIFLISLFVILFSARTMGQNESLLPLFDQAKSYFCPAFTGDKGKASGYVIGGHQYGNPYYRSYYYTKHPPDDPYNKRSGLTIDYSAPIINKDKHRINLGAFYSYQKRPFTYDLPILNKSNFRINISYSYLSKIGTFSAGGYVDETDMKTDLSYYQPGLIAKGSLFNTGTGISFRSKNQRFYFGASAGNVSIQSLKFKYKNAKVAYFYTEADYYIITGLDIPINNKITLTPAMNIWINYTAFISSNIMFDYKKQYIAGLQYLNDGGWEFGSIRLGYKNKLNSLAFHYSYLLQIHGLEVLESGQHNLGIVYTPKRD